MLVDRLLGVGISENLFELLKLESPDSDGAKKASKRLVLPKRRLLAIILFEKQDNLRINNLETMHYPNGLPELLDSEQIQL